MKAEFRSESDIRRWVREVLPAPFTPRWIEPGLGSTPGLPDCIVPMGGGIDQWLELKFCEGPKNGWLSFKVQPDQRREIPRMLADGMRVAVLIGLPGRVILACPTDAVLSGRIQDEPEKTRLDMVLPLESGFDLIDAFDAISLLHE